MALGSMGWLCSMGWPCSMGCWAGSGWLLVSVLGVSVSGALCLGLALGARFASGAACFRGGAAHSFDLRTSARGVRRC